MDRIYPRASILVSPRSFFFGSLIVWNIWFPKAGIYVGSVPLTLGYFLVGVSTVACLPVLLSGLSRYQALGLFLAETFLGWYLLFNVANGYDDEGMFISCLVSFGILPLFWVGLMPLLLTRKSYSVTRTAIRYGLIFTAAYGIVNFIYFCRTGANLSLPGLTNGLAAPVLLSDRDNLRLPGIEKLISTYQNGNLYGVCTLQLLPFFLLIEKRPIPRLIVIAALILTLSRSVWIGLSVLLLCSSIVTVLRYDLNRATAKALSIGGALVAVSAAVVWVTRGVLDRNFLAFIADPQLGGRLGELQVPWKLLPLHVIHPEWEIVWTSILDNYGYFGVVLFGAALFWPLFVADFYKHSEPRALLAGVFIYAVMCCEDGGIELIPTMFVFWLLIGLLLFHDRYRTKRPLFSDV